MDMSSASIVDDSIVLRINARMNSLPLVEGCLVVTASVSVSVCVCVCVCVCV